MRIHLLLAFVLMSALFLNACGGGSSSSNRVPPAEPPAEPPIEPPRGSPADYAVTVDGNVWLQPVDFTGYRYDQVNAVCPPPNGACSGSLQGSTFDLTGYRWASIMDVSSLFNAYGVNPPFTEPFQFREDHDANEAMSQDFEETANYCEGDCPLVIIYVAGMVRDQAPAATQPYVAVAYQNETSEFYNTTPLTEGSETPPHPGFHPPEDVVGVWFWKSQLDTVSVDGREWAQVVPFTNLSWNDIDAVCPEGACAGTLNGHDMTGWTWASIDDASALFSAYQQMNKSILEDFAYTTSDKGTHILYAILSDLPYEGSESYRVYFAVAGQSPPYDADNENNDIDDAPIEPSESGSFYGAWFWRPLE